MNNAIVINNVAVRINRDGLYRLNDIHAGSPVAELKHKSPNQWARDAGAEVIAAAQAQSEKSHSGTESATYDDGSQTAKSRSGTKSSTYVVINGGNAPGTYASKDLVYAYAMWLSPEFMLHVIRVFDAVVTQARPALAVPPALQDLVGALLLIGDAIGKVPGVNPAIAHAGCLAMIHEQTGIDTEPMRRCLPTAQGPTASMNPTRLAKLVGGGVTPQGVNCALESMGLQQKCLRGGWELTEAGKAYGEMLPFSRNGHAGYQVLWGESVVPGLYDYFLGGMDA